MLYEFWDIRYKTKQETQNCYLNVVAVSVVFSLLLTLCILTFVYLSIYFAYQIIASHTSIRSHQVFIDSSSSRVFSSFSFVLAVFLKDWLSCNDNEQQQNRSILYVFCLFDFSQFWWPLFSIRIVEKTLLFSLWTWKEVRKIRRYFVSKNEWKWEKRRIKHQVKANNAHIRETYLFVCAFDYANFYDKW